jgi:Smg protein
MKEEKVLDVLMYIFENYMDDSHEFSPDQDALLLELSQAGFPKGEINKAFDWLEELSSLRDAKPVGKVSSGRTTSTRYFSQIELTKINMTCRGQLLRLEQSGVLDPIAREIVIDRIMALESEEIDIEQLKWVVLMVLFNQPGQEQAYDLLEDWVVSEKRDFLF